MRLYASTVISSTISPADWPPLFTIADAYPMGLVCQQHPTKLQEPLTSESTGPQSHQSACPPVTAYPAHAREPQRPCSAAPQSQPAGSAPSHGHTACPGPAAAGRSKSCSSRSSRSPRRRFCNISHPFRSGALSRLDSTHDFFAPSGAADSFAVTNRVPTQTASAPSISAEATLRPSNMPPAATSCTGCPEMGDLYCRHTSAQAGMRTLRCQ
jgi:uncharacterized protein involved in copper resistance